MTRHDLDRLADELNNQFAHLQRLGDFNANASDVRFAIKSCLIMARHLVDLDKEIAKLKRGVTSFRPKKK